MADAKRDSNRIPTVLAVSESDGTTLVNVYADPTTHRLLTDVAIDAGDLEIGAVELKNATDDTRAKIKTDGTDNALVVVQNTVPTTTVTATNLDIRDLSSASDSVTVTGTVTANAGTGTMTVDLGANNDVTVTSGAITASQGGAPWTMDLTKVAGESVQVAGGTEEKSIRVTVASDSTGLLSVDDNSSSLTVDTTGTSGLEVVQNTAADLNVTEASASDIKTAVQTIDNCISGSEAQVDVVASLPAGTNNIGDVDVATMPGWSYDYIASAGTNEVTKNSAGVLHAIIVGDAVASSVIEVSDHASDGDGNVVIYLAGDALGPAVYPVNMTMGTGITSDITNQTHVTLVYR